MRDRQIETPLLHYCFQRFRVETLEKKKLVNHNSFYVAVYGKKEIQTHVTVFEFENTSSLLLYFAFSKKKLCIQSHNNSLTQVLVIQDLTNPFQKLSEEYNRGGVRFLAPPSLVQ